MKKVCVVVPALSALGFSPPVSQSAAVVAYAHEEDLLVAGILALDAVR